MKKQIAEGTQKKRVGFTMNEGSSVREGAVFVKDGKEIGYVCSGGYSPMLKHPIGMAYIETRHAVIDNELDVNFRGKNFKVKISKMPFYPTNYFK